MTHLYKFIEEEECNQEKVENQRDRSYVSNNNIISFLLSFLESISACSTVNYEETCWSFVCCNLHSHALIKSGLTGASARDCACYSADLIPGKYIHTRVLVYRVFSFKPRISNSLDRDTARRITLLCAITSDLTRLIFRIVLIKRIN